MGFQVRRALSLTYEPKPTHSYQVPAGEGTFREILITSLLSGECLFLAKNQGKRSRIFGSANKAGKLVIHDIFEAWVSRHFCLRELTLRQRVGLHRQVVRST